MTRLPEILGNTLNSGNGNDKLNIGLGYDRLTGGVGNDQLTGRAGDDIFQINTGSGRDVIKDFTDGDDQIKLSTDTDTVNLIQFGDHVKARYDNDLMTIIHNIETIDLTQQG